MPVGCSCAEPVGVCTFCTLSVENWYVSYSNECSNLAKTFPCSNVTGLEEGFKILMGTTPSLATVTNVLATIKFL
ncbi:hypothetical protein CI610_02905 [invertebrate metagenome]|uniref:Uncharacterized protein n=1 Tax=invertebrate metagenome TaxID=1711999 RepID=A0A2H9T4N1_9ZZZZ